MPESYVQWTLSLGEAQRIQRALYDAHYDDDALALLTLIEEGPHLTHDQLPPSSFAQSLDAEGSTDVPER